MLHFRAGILSLSLSPLFLVVGAIVLRCSAAAAQVPASSLEPGDTVRYQFIAPPDKAPEYVTGALEAVSATSILVAASPAADTIRLSTLASLDVARGSRDYVFPMWTIGAVVGCAAGVVIAGSGGDEANPTNHRIGGCVIGLGVGVAAGIFVGGRIRTPNWVRVEVDPAGQLGLVLPLGP